MVRSYRWFVVAMICGMWGVASGQQPANDSPALIEKENIVDVSSGGAGWASATVGQPLKTHDKVRTGEDSRAAVRLADASVLRVDELTTTEILPPKTAADKATLSVEQGSTYFFSREKAREVKLETPSANGAIRGTEFVVKVAANGYTTVTMLDGELELSNSAGSILVHSGEEGQVARGQRPTKTAALYAMNTVQWCLYYPGVLDPAEIPVSGRWGEAYREGDLLRALEERRPSRSRGVYDAQLYLAVGQVDKARAVLRRTNARGAAALRTLIAAVTYADRPSGFTPTTATDWVAESYYRQSRADLNGALEAAQRAAEIDKSFGFAWTRVAELQFSFGRIPQAEEALEHGLVLTPRNPSAHALRGFLYTADNSINKAKQSFEDAIAIDGALGDAWLGHGLSLIRQGHDVEGRHDLQIAAAMEPNRAIFHSYLGKAFSNVGVESKARAEFERAKAIDPKDPTPWIYSAIENKQDNRVNEAVHDLEKSQELNDNRQVYRSQFLLDQDRAVRSANLAAIYQADGMEDVSVREAQRGVDSDYSNASAHLFLANSYNALRDPKRINLRYETPWFNELLLSNLLSPVGGGPLSQFVSEMEYSKLFEADRLGISSTFNYLSTGEIRETASQYGQYQNFSYALDTEYHYDNGLRPNNQFTRSESYGQAKVQVTPQDTFFFQTKYQDARTGDLLQYYDQAQAQQGVGFRELQQPAILLLGYHHNWTPGLDTLVLAGRLADDITFDNVNSTHNVNTFLRTGFPDVSRSLIFTHDPNGDINDFFELPLDLHYHNVFTTYTVEAQQIWEIPQNTLIAGGRYQNGDFHTTDLFERPPGFAVPFFNMPPARNDIDTNLERETAYIYDTWRPFSGLSLTGGVSYDHLDYPSDYRNPPVTGAQQTRDRVSPKAGVIWNPFGNFTVRGAYTRSLGGVSFDESVLLEPNQVAGFNQVFRSVISESIVGSVAGSTFESGGILIEDRFPTGTYVSAQAGVLRSKVDRTIGTFDATLSNFGGIVPPVLPLSTEEKLRYEEDSLLFTANQLVGNEWSFGARYQLTFSDLQTLFPEVPRTASLSGLADSRTKATLHQGDLFALYNHPSGFYAELEGYWARQSNIGYSPDEPGDEIFQLNAYVGYRLRRNFGDITLGFLDINDQDYKLNPLNYYNELPRSRTLLVRVRFTF